MKTAAKKRPTTTAKKAAKKAAKKSAKKLQSRQAPAKPRAQRRSSGAETRAKPLTKVVSATSTIDGRLSFNHAMIYVKDVGRAMHFYRDLLGFRVIEDFRHEGMSVYARLRAPGGDGTIALHLAGPGTSLASDGVRLYFEVRELDDFCNKLQRKGFYITQLPRLMPWGWRHAYLNDPDGHEISLYWAGEQRMEKSVMEAAKKAGRS